MAELTAEQIERIQALLKLADNGEGEWQPGLHGNADLVAYNGEDIVGIAVVNYLPRVLLIAALRNTAPALCDLAIKGLARKPLSEERISGLAARARRHAWTVEETIRAALKEAEHE